MQGGKSKIPTDFSNLRLSDINGTMEDFLIRDDTTSFSISDLAFTEKEGFKVKRMNSKVVIKNNDILFHSAQVFCDSSILNIEQVRFTGDSVTSFSNFLEDVKMDVRVDRSLISSSDLKYFVPGIRDINQSVWFSGKVTGTVSELRGRNINISYGDYTNLECDFDLSGLPEIENSFIYLGINSLRTNAKDIERIKISGKESIKPA